ncbi:hypothetical protein LPJ61_002619 [Coemansia biformis]|uniref:Methyltransferase domain-containing protein n=1 Tax=Coemansia biformis TaxID=1286918 RepID=A0A9W8CZG2_9FUNG|nr:hypothetical protein LPJ61_002619 [Coemansia biformis]
MAELEIALPEGVGSVDEYAAALRRAYTQYGYLPRMGIVDFFVERLWEQLPSEWRAYFGDGAFDIGSLIPLAAAGQLGPGAPESLQAYVGDMFRLRLAGGHAAEGDGSAGALRHFLDGMSPKKQVEVAALSRVVDEAAAATGSGLVVDVGAGQGYLSRVLAYGPTRSQPRVLAVDSRIKQGAERLQRRTVKRLGGQQARRDGVEWDSARASRLQHAIMRVDMDSGAELREMAHGAAPGEPWMLCGLHACGDLSSAVLRVFAESDARAVVVVPCCYNHISEPPAGRGFPMSRAMDGVVLGRNVLKTACQATARWDASPEATTDTFRRNYFRAVLHQLMVAHGQLAADTVPAVGRVTRSELAAAQAECGPADGATADERAFTVYARAALGKLGLAWRPTAAQCVECCRQAGGGLGLGQIAAVWALRSLAGPVIEAMLVVDRALFLAAHCEAGSRVQAYALFDAATSPRNVVLVAQRPAAAAIVAGHA